MFKLWSGVSLFVKNTSHHHLKEEFVWKSQWFVPSLGLLAVPPTLPRSLASAQTVEQLGHVQRLIQVWDQNIFILISVGAKISCLPRFVRLFLSPDCNVAFLVYSSELSLNLLCENIWFDNSPFKWIHQLKLDPETCPTSLHPSLPLSIPPPLTQNNHCPVHLPSRVLPLNELDILAAILDNKCP